MPKGLSILLAGLVFDLRERTGLRQAQLSRSHPFLPPSLICVPSPNTYSYKLTYVFRSLILPPIGGGQGPVSTSLTLCSVFLISPYCLLISETTQPTRPSLFTSVLNVLPPLLSPAENRPYLKAYPLCSVVESVFSHQAYT